MKWEGASQVTQNFRGDLRLTASLVQRNPLILQDGKQIAGGYAVHGREVGFAVGRYDASKPLVIDPVLVYSTYFGGGLYDFGYGIAVDGSDNAYVTGQTQSINFPISGPLQGIKGGGAYDVFVTKFNAAGSALLYSTYLGGAGNDTGYGIAVDGAGNAYVTGYTESADFPTSNPLRNSLRWQQ